MIKLIAKLATQTIVMYKLKSFVKKRGSRPMSHKIIDHILIVGVISLMYNMLAPSPNSIVTVAIVVLGGLISARFLYYHHKKELREKKDRMEKIKKKTEKIQAALKRKNAIQNQLRNIEGVFESARGILEISDKIPKIQYPTNRLHKFTFPILRKRKST